MKEQKEKQNQYKRRSRDKTQNVRQQNNQNDDIPNAIFKNKMAKCRALKRLKDTLPASPSKKQAILKHYMCVSPTAKQSLKRQSPSLSEKVLENMKGFIHETKQKRNYDARNAMHVISASVSGEKLSKGEKSKAAHGIDSTLDSPVIVSEQFFVISPDLDHDRHYTRYVQTLISKYLKSISAEIKYMHEFTDGCSAQYKSRNCMGDVCTHRSDLGYDVLIRNYFETSHGKGPHDAAGGFLKNQADYAVLRGKTKIQTARDLYDFAQKNLQIPQSGILIKNAYLNTLLRFLVSKI
ncbi:Hypothetical predicted protein [Mytilus galloprovincialis]|uniref:Uncharacterized protein n=1 Tax=Mytilus galloprovincialis TaxID=29158 RepID=A0A8B6EBZ9_MYTGA|nr:Hypothetical predicted protein [Mytilus galloprovincialis]